MDLKDLFEFFIKGCRNRNVAMPSKEGGVILYDGDGNERLMGLREPQLHNTFEVATIGDFLSYVRDIPKRYPADVKTLRELTVMVDHTDTPSSVEISLPKNQRLAGGASFVMKAHEDFKTWFDGKLMDQTQFMRRLIELEDQHDCGDLAKALAFLEYKTEVTYEATAETERNYVLGYTEKESKSGVKIPKIINVKCPVISGANYITETAFDIIIKKPKQDDPSIKFKLSPSGKDPVKIYRDACIHIAENELLVPALTILGENGVDVTTPLYIRSGVKTSEFDPAGDLRSI